MGGGGAVGTRQESEMHNTVSWRWTDKKKTDKHANKKTQLSLGKGPSRQTDAHHRPALAAVVHSTHAAAATRQLCTALRVSGRQEAPSGVN